MNRFVQHAIHDRVATVRLNRPDLHNAFNEVVIEELTGAFVELGCNPETRVILLTAEGKSFCAGADIHWMKRMVDYSFKENVADATMMANMLQSIRACPRPVIARIHGATIGGGVGLAAACDIAVAVRTAIFSLSEVKLGILPAVISPYVLEKIGPSHMRRYALTAERFDSIDARRIGLIAESFETEADMDNWIEKTIATLMANGPEALTECKRVLRDVQDLDWTAKQTLTIEAIANRRVSTEGQEGLKAFLEKRPPTWVKNP
ncbi:MAG: enoyl-CoA hydratase/isomerase family protein [Phycisphaerae bacterium]